MTDFRLTEIDKRSTLWRQLAEHYETRLGLLRAQNDITQTPEQTEKLRGRIAEIKAFLALADEPRKLTA